MRNFFLITSLVCSFAVNADMSANELAKIASERADAITVDVAIPDVESNERAKTAAATGRKRGLAELKRMNAEYRQKHAKAFTEMSAIADGATEVTAPRQGRLVVALSSSMPEQMVADYLVQLSGIPEAIVVLRGFIGGATYVKPTGQWIDNRLRKVADCQDCGHYSVEVVIDPLIYQDLNIGRVPAIAWLPGVTDLKHCDEEVFEATTVVYGATAVEAALRTMVKAGTEVPEDLIDRIKASGWEDRT